MLCEHTTTRKCKETSKSHDRRNLTSHIKAQCDNVRVQHGCVEWRHKQVKIGDHDRHGTIDDAVRSIYETLGLVCEAGVVARECQY